MAAAPGAVVACMEARGMPAAVVVRSLLVVEEAHAEMVAAGMVAAGMAAEETVAVTVAAAMVAVGRAP